MAAREALGDDGDRLPWQRERVGVTAGTWNAGTSALLEVLRSVFFASPDEAPPAQFPSTVANAPASQLGILEKLGGPNMTFAEKQVGGLRAIAEAARMLISRRADAVLACGADEGDWLNAEGYSRLGALRTDGRAGMALCEGAAALVLALEPGPKPLAALAGWSSASTAAPPYAYPDDPHRHRSRLRHGHRPGGIHAAQDRARGEHGERHPRARRARARGPVAGFGPRRPAAIGAAERFGDGAAAGTLRAMIAALSVGRRVRLRRWGPPARLAGAGFPSVSGRARTALVAGSPAAAPRSPWSSPRSDRSTANGRHARNQASSVGTILPTWVPGQYTLPHRRHAMNRPACAATYGGTRSSTASRRDLLEQARCNTSSG